MITIQEDSFKDHIQEGLSLIKDHWAQTGSKNGPVEYVPDIMLYRRLEQSGNLCSVSVKKDDELIGYLVCYIEYHPHHLGVKFATSDLLYLKPEYRRGSLGIKLIKKTEEILRDKYNVKYFRLLENANFKLGSLFKRLGYEVTDITYLKPLGD